MAFDWKSMVRKVAPTLASALGTPLAGAAVAAISEAVLGKAEGTEAEIATALQQGMAPDAVVALRSADQAFTVRMRELDIDIDRMFLADTQNARHHNADNRGVFWLGVAILAVFAVVCGSAVIGAYMMATSQVKIDPGMVAAVFTFIGTTVGYAAAQAQSVVNFHFGSSRGSEGKTQLLVDAVSKIR